MYLPLFQQDLSTLDPQCPHCQEPVLASYLFCRSCGASLIFPEFDRTFCPFCGIRVGKRQEFCHECCGYLIAEEKIIQETERLPFLQRFSSKLRTGKKKYRGLSLLTGAFIFASIAYLAFNKTAMLDMSLKQRGEKLLSQATPVDEKTRPQQFILQKVPVSLPLSDSKQPVDSQLSQLLNQIREAQLQKNINLFMSSFSPNFYQLKEKRLTALKIWQLYDFVDMNFEIKDIQKQDNNNASAKVYWEIEAKNKNTDRIEHFIKSYCVSFSKEGDKWFINDM